MVWKDDKRGSVKGKNTKKSSALVKPKSIALDAQLTAAASCAAISKRHLEQVLSRRGAVSEQILSQLASKFKPVVETRNSILFTGRSVTSIVPVVFQRGTISKSALEILVNSFNEVDAKHWKHFTKEGNRSEHEAHFRRSQESAAAKTNGGDWRRLAPHGVCRFVDEFLEHNSGFVRGIRSFAATKPTYRHCGKEMHVFEQPDCILCNLFSYVQMSSFPEGSSDTWHCDGGPSMIFMAVSVQGERILQVEDAVGNLKNIHLHEGEAYVSTPCSFWHAVKPIGRRPSKTLILRSSVLTRRYSGGRNNSYRQEDVGTTGYPMETKEAFENMAQAMSRLLGKATLRFKFRME